MEDKKFCTSCQMHKPVEGGMVQRTKTTRWKCKGCLTKKAPSIYTKVMKEALYDHRD
jgi:ribosomal protein L37AE/L43A